MNTNKLLRHINAVRSLRLLSRGQVMSRAEIARDLGLTRATIGYAIAALTEAGLIVESAESAPEGRKGRPGIGIQLNPSGAYFLGVDIGTKVLTTVLVDLSMTVVARNVEATGDNFREPEPIVARLLPAARGLVRKARIAPALVQGVGVSVPGIVAHDGSVVNAPYLEWRDYPLRDKLVQACSEGWPVVVCNDAFAFANAERAALTEV
jgi:DNA-binding transcriptional ArsR family regulator